MTSNPDLELEAEVERLFALYPPPPGFDDALHRRYLADCVRSGIEPHQLPDSGRQVIADVLARVARRLEAEQVEP